MIKSKKFSSVGLLGYGAYIPSFRVKIEKIAQVWGKEGRLVSQSLGVKQKAVADTDEDCLTMAVEASQQAIALAGVSPEKIGACFVGSESFPYAVKPTGVTLSEILGIDNQYFCVDLQFACKAATTGMQIVAAMIEAGMIEYGLVVGSDKAQSRPADALEFTAGAGAAAFVLGKTRNCLAKLQSTDSFNSDTPDFWRRQSEAYPSHAGRFTGEPAYFRHVIQSSLEFLKRIKKKPSSFDYAVFHAPNLKFPLKAARSLGFNDKQLRFSLLVQQIGNPYSASALLGLVNVLDNAKAGESIFMTSYGSGAGSDNFSFKTTKNLVSLRKRKEKLEKMLKETVAIDYPTYLRKMEIL